MKGRGDPDARIREEQPAGHTRGRGSVRVDSNLVPAALLVASCVLYVMSLPHIPYRRMNDYGLVSVLPVTFYAAFGVLAIGFVLALRPPPSVATASLPLCRGPHCHRTCHASDPVSHAALQLDVQVRRCRGLHSASRWYVNRTLSLAIFQNWPGFFALEAFFTGPRLLERPALRGLGARVHEPGVCRGFALHLSFGDPRQPARLAGCLVL